MEDKKKTVTRTFTNASRASTNPDLLRSATIQSQKSHPEIPSLSEDDAFLRKWSGPILLGTFLPALFSIITIVSGHLVLNTWTGYCGYALDTFISLALFVCYIFLLVYSWSFLGSKVYVTVPFTGMGFHLLRPFRSLKWLMGVYMLIAFVSFLIWCIGTALLDLSLFCAGTAPMLYEFSTYLVVTYWLGFFIIGCYLIKLKFGNLIENFVNSQAKGPSIEDMEERVFRKEFKKLDKKKSGTLPQELLADFFVKVAVFVPEEEMPAVLNQLGVVGDQEVDFFPLLEWYKDYNAKNAGYAGDDDDPEDAAMAAKLEASSRPPPSKSMSAVSAKSEKED